MGGTDCFSGLSNSRGDESKSTGLVLKKRQKNTPGPPLNPTDPDLLSLSYLLHEDLFDKLTPEINCVALGRAPFPLNSETAAVVCGWLQILAFLARFCYLGSLAVVVTGVSKDLLRSILKTQARHMLNMKGFPKQIYFTSLINVEEEASTMERNLSQSADNQLCTAKHTQHTQTITATRKIPWGLRSKLIIRRSRGTSTTHQQSAPVSTSLKP